MRRWFLHGIVFGTVLMSMGCVLAVGNRVPCSTQSQKQVIVKDGEVYIVNLDDGSVEKVAPECVREAAVIESKTVEASPPAQP